MKKKYQAMFFSMNNPTSAFAKEKYYGTLEYAKSCAMSFMIEGEWAYISDGEEYSEVLMKCAPAS